MYIYILVFAFCSTCTLYVYITYIHAYVHVYYVYVYIHIDYIHVYVHVMYMMYICTLQTGKDKPTKGIHTSNEMYRPI